jgi:UDP-N-acetylglucosamine--N-acetylmuramyl-(pentapeptide) pyrophosphoryl-undecaprenol N-acetylglucosamine transferase
LVIGGSGGAKSLNENVPKALYKLRDLLNGWQIVHQTGAGDAGKTRELYRKLALPAIAVPFVENMPAVMRRTAVAVCRAGGSTLSELAATGLPAVLVPYPHASSNHQRLNAEVIAAAGGARIVDERDTTGRLDDAIADALGHLLADSLLRQKMSAAALHLARPEAARRVARMIYELAHQRAGRQAA